MNVISHAFSCGSKEHLDKLKSYEIKMKLRSSNPDVAAGLEYCIRQVALFLRNGHKGSALFLVIDHPDESDEAHLEIIDCSYSKSVKDSFAIGSGAILFHESLKDVSESLFKYFGSTKLPGNPIFSRPLPLP